MFKHLSLVEREQALAAILATAVGGIVVIDQGGIVQSFNATAERIFGYKAEEVIGKNVSMLMPTSYRDTHDVFLRRYVGTGIPSIIGKRRELIGQRRDGSLFSLELVVTDLHLIGRRLFTGIVNDISARVALEKQIMDIALEEQQRIGQELHDTISQELLALALFVSVLGEKLTRGENADELIANLKAGLKRVQRKIRDLSHGLVPAEVAPGGLPDALRILALFTAEQSGVAITFDCTKGELTLDSASADQLYRIAQEAVSNSVRHGSPRNVRIALEFDTDVLTLQIADDGVGIPSAPTTGRGLSIMRYRARQIGGSLLVSPVNGGGTNISCIMHRDMPKGRNALMASELNNNEDPGSV